MIHPITIRGINKEDLEVISAYSGTRVVYQSADYMATNLAIAEVEVRKALKKMMNKN